MKILAIPNVNSKYTGAFTGKTSFIYVDLCDTVDEITPSGVWGGVGVDFFDPLGKEVYDALYSGKPVLLSIEVAEDEQEAQ